MVRSRHSAGTAGTVTEQATTMLWSGQNTLKGAEREAPHRGRSVNGDKATLTSYIRC